MRRIAAAVVLVLLVAGCGGARAKTAYSIAATKKCARAHGRVLRPKANDFVASTASGGAFRLELRHNQVTVLFGENDADALGLANGYRRFHAKNVGIEDILRIDKNVVLLWRFHPSDADENRVVSCLS